MSDSRQIVDEFIKNFPFPSKHERQVYVLIFLVLKMVDYGYDDIEKWIDFLIHLETRMLALGQEIIQLSNHYQYFEELNTTG